LPGGKHVSGSDAKLFILAEATFTIRERSCSEYPSPGARNTWAGTNFYQLLLTTNDFNYAKYFLIRFATLLDSIQSLLRKSSSRLWLSGSDAKLYMPARAIAIIIKFRSFGAFGPGVPALD
jgi:hypothetical protein